MINFDYQSKPVPLNRISEIVNGKRSITTDTALRLQRYFGVEAQFWLNLQTEYNLRMMKHKIWSEIEQQIIPAQASKALPEDRKPNQRMLEKGARG